MCVYQQQGTWGLRNQLMEVLSRALFSLASPTLGSVCEFTILNHVWLVRSLTKSLTIVLQSLFSAQFITTNFSIVYCLDVLPICGSGCVSLSLIHFFFFRKTDPLLLSSRMGPRRALWLLKQATVCQICMAATWSHVYRFSKFHQVEVLGSCLSCRQSATSAVYVECVGDCFLSNPLFNLLNWTAFGHPENVGLPVFLHGWQRK